MTARTTPLLTRDFLQGTDGKVVFTPATMEEAEYIATQLQRLGYRYYKPEYAQQLDNAIKGSIYLDADKTIMVSTGKADGINASADGFDNFYLSGFDAASARITPQELQAGIFAFFPRSTAEARGLLAALKDAGATIDSEDGMFMLAGRAVYQGVLVRQGRIGFAPAGEDLQAARIASAADLGVGVPVALSPEQATMIAGFNEVAARMEQMAARLERLEGEILPKKLEKPKALPGPKG